MSLPVKVYLSVFILILAVTQFGLVKTLSPEPRIETTNGKPIKLSLAQQQEKQHGLATGKVQRSDESNEIDDRIHVAEPYKSLIQSTARFALVQTKISNHVNIETAMNFINDAGFMLSKPANLFRVIKVVAVSIATFLASSLLFPNAYRTLDALWQDPVHTLHLDRYFSNGFSEKSIIGLMSGKVDETLSRIGLYDSSCRELSACYIGEALKYAFPDTANAAIKFGSEHLSGFSYKDNKYVKAFSFGFVDRNCTSTYAGSALDSNHCLGNLLNNMIISRWIGNPPPKYQNIKVGRA